MTTQEPQKRRLRSTEEHGVGSTRYDLLKSTAIRVQQALDAGFYLEATTLLESLIAERLEKRAQYFWRSQGRDSKELARVK